jgi:hypothetical protein
MATEYIENYKIVFDIDATGTGVNINVGGGGSVGQGGGITTTTAGGAGGLLGGIISSITEVAESQVAKLTGMTRRGTTLQERVNNLRKYGRFGSPSKWLTGKGTTEVGYMIGNLNPADLGRSKWRAWNEKDRAFSKAEEEFARAVRSKGWNKQDILESARARWAAQEAAKKSQVYGLGIGNPIPQQYMGYQENPAFTNPGIPSGTSYSLIGEYDMSSMIKRAERTRK